MVEQLIKISGVSYDCDLTYYVLYDSYWSGIYTFVADDDLSLLIIKLQ